MNKFQKIVALIKSEILLSSAKDAPLIRKVVKKGLTYLEPEALIGIQKVVLDIESKNIPGIFCECGVASGGSAILIAQWKSPERILNLYDSFETIPAPTEKDGKDAHDCYAVISSGKSSGVKGTKYYGYENDLLQKVKDDFSKYLDSSKISNVEFIQGYYEDSLSITSDIAFAHIDCDWYSSVMVCLEVIAPQLSIGGMMIIDDYYHYSGCKKAVDEYFATVKGYEFEHKSRLHITRKS